MAGRREKKKRWGIRIPGILGLMAIMAVLFSPVGPGKAIESPVSEPEPPEVTVPQTPKRPVQKRQPGKMPEQAVSDPPAEEPDAVQSQEAVVQEAPWAPVPESEAVEDTYFQDVIFFGRLPYGRIFPVQRPEGRNLFLFRGRDGGVGFFPKIRGPWKMEAKFPCWTPWRRNRAERSM